MLNFDINDLQADLIQDEGLRLNPYVDSVGKLTIGVGRNLTTNGISKDEAMDMLHHDINSCIDSLQRTCPWFGSLSGPRQRVIINMCFNLGLGGLMKFKGMITAIQSGNWELAATHIIESKAGTELPSRYGRLAAMMRNG